MFKLQIYIALILWTVLEKHFPNASNVEFFLDILKHLCLNLLTV